MARVPCAIAPDLYGFGYSSKPKRPDLYQIAAYTAFLDKFLDVLELKQVAMVTHDDAGWAGIQLALAHPERVSHLVILNTPVHREVWHRLPRVRLLRRRILGERMADLLLTKGWLKRTLRGWVVHKERMTDPVVEHYYWPFTDGTRWVILTLTHNFDSRFQHTPYEQGEIQSLRVPTLIISGGADPLQARRVEERAHQNTPNLRRVVQEKAGHLLPEDQPQEIARLVLDFVRHA